VVRVQNEVIKQREAEVAALLARVAELEAESERLRVLWERDSAAFGTAIAQRDTARAEREDYRARLAEVACENTDLRWRITELAQTAEDLRHEVDEWKRAARREK
jgi:uncharacterized coiled-coil DUF342 family protein